MGPRDTPTGVLVEINWRTGNTITENQKKRLLLIEDAALTLVNAMHHADGTSEGAERFGSRSMAIAATQIEIGVEMAYKACLEAK